MQMRNGTRNLNFPFSISVEPKTYPNSGYFHGSKTTDWDAFYRQLSNCRYWRDLAEAAFVRLFERFGPNQMHHWISVNIIDGESWLSIYDKAHALETCAHEHTEQETLGSLRMEGGEVWDTLVDVVVCTDCGMIIDPARENMEDEQK